MNANKPTKLKPPPTTATLGPGKKKEKGDHPYPP